MTNTQKNGKHLSHANLKDKKCTPKHEQYTFWHGNGEFGYLKMSDLFPFPTDKEFYIKKAVTRQHPYPFNYQIFHPKTGEVYFAAETLDELKDLWVDFQARESKTYKLYKSAIELYNAI